MLEKGAIYLHRKITKWRWYSDKITLSVFLHLLLTVNYEDRGFDGIIVKRGQRVASLETLSNELQISISLLRTAIKHLKMTNEITSVSTSKYTVFTVVNYDKYQSVDKPNDKRLTNGRQTLDNNVIKINKDNNPPTPLRAGDGVSFEAFFSAYPKKTEKSKAEKIFKEKNFNKRQFDWVMRVLEEDKRSDQWKRENGRYIPKACNWLENNMYDRELKETPIRIFSTDP